MALMAGHRGPQWSRLPDSLRSRSSCRFSIGSSGLQLKLDAKAHRDGGLPGIPRLQARLKPSPILGHQSHSRVTNLYGQRSRPQRSSPILNLTSQIGSRPLDYSSNTGCFGPHWTPPGQTERSPYPGDAGQGRMRGLQATSRDWTPQWTLCWLSEAQTLTGIESEQVSSVNSWAWTVGRRPSRCPVSLRGWTIGQLGQTRCPTGFADV